MFTLSEVQSLILLGRESVNEMSQRLYLYFETEVEPTLRNMIVGHGPTVLVESLVELERNWSLCICRRLEK